MIFPHKLFQKVMFEAFHYYYFYNRSITKFTFIAFTEMILKTTLSVAMKFY